MTLPVVFKCGDEVIATCGGKTVDAMVTLASPNARSLIISFEAMLAGHVGTMPLLWHDGDGEYVSLMGAFPVTLALRPEATQ